jgi:hypothetical protein
MVLERKAEEIGSTLRKLMAVIPLMRLSPRTLFFLLQFKTRGEKDLGGNPISDSFVLSVFRNSETEDEGRKAGLGTKYVCGALLSHSHILQAPISWFVNMFNNPHDRVGKRISLYDGRREEVRGGFICLPSNSKYTILH